MLTSHANDAVPGLIAWISGNERVTAGYKVWQLLGCWDRHRCVRCCMFFTSTVSTTAHFRYKCGCIHWQLWSFLQYN